MMPTRLERLRQWVNALPQAQRLPFFKLITGALRIGVSKLQVVQALAEATGVEAKRMAQRMMGYTQAGRTLARRGFRRADRPRRRHEEQGAAGGHPYPFFLAHSFQAPLDEMPALLGPVENWLVEWKFDGIRAQYIQRAGQWWLWSRGEELVSESFPELAALRDWVPDGDRPRRRACRRQAERRRMRASPARDDARRHPARSRRCSSGSAVRISARKYCRNCPVALIAYDILEASGQDIRHRPQSARRRSARGRSCARRVDRAAAIGAGYSAAAQPGLARARLARARSLRGDGAPLRRGRHDVESADRGIWRRSAQSGVGGADLWWKWKLDPMSVDAVLVYAQRGHGRRSGVYSDYTSRSGTGRPKTRRAPWCLSPKPIRACRTRKCAKSTRYPKDDGRELRPGAQRASDDGVRTRFRRALR